MFYGNSVKETRKLFFDSWAKFRSKKSLEPIEQQIVAVIKDHPEYHGLLEQEPESDKTYFPELGETNPFLHMGLHIAIREQASTNRPAGITKIYQDLIKKLGASLEAEHVMMECLAESLWQAQKEGTMPDEQQYLTCCNQCLFSF